MKRGDPRARSACPTDVHPFVIGLTGPIASGKSVVAGMLRDHGADVIDADQVYRSLLVPGSDLWHKLVSRFGESILRPNDEIDRGELGRRVFEDPHSLADLDQLTHPAVVTEIRRLIAKSSARVVVIEAVKLVQAGLLDDVDALWVVTADADTRSKRLISRTGMDESAARQRIAASVDRTMSEVPIDVTIDNSGPIVATKRAVEAAWTMLDVCSGRAESTVTG